MDSNTSMRQTRQEYWAKKEISPDMLYSAVQKLSMNLKRLSNGGFFSGISAKVKMDEKERKWLNR